MSSSLSVKREQMLQAASKRVEVSKRELTTGSDLVKNVVALVKASCEREDFSEIGEQLRTLKLTTPQITNETVCALITQVKEVTPRLDLPIVYRHLIQDLKLGADGDYLSLAQLSPKDEAFRIECAFLAAESKVKLFVATVHRYRIRDQAALFSLAKMCAMECGCFLSHFVDRFGIKEDKYLFGVAKVVQDHSTEDMPFDIEKFPIKEEALRVELAKREAMRNSSNLVRNIHKYQIASEEARTEIAKIAASKNGVETAGAIDQFSIADPMRRLEIFLVAVKQNKGSIQHIKKFQLGLEEKALLMSRYVSRLEGAQALSVFLLVLLSENNPEKVKEIAASYPELTGFGFAGNLTHYMAGLWKVEAIPYSVLISLYDRSRELLGEENSEAKARKTALLSLEISAWHFAWNCPALLKTLLAEIEKVKGERNSVTFTYRSRAIFSVLLECRALKIDRNILAQHADVLTAILDIRNREVRNCLLPRFMDWFSTSPRPVKFPSKASAITAILLSPLMAKVKVPTDFIQRVEKAVQLKAFRRDDTTFKSLLQNLMVLVDTPSLSEQEKVDILNTLIFFKGCGTADTHAKRVYASAQLLAQFVSCGEAKGLLAYEGFDDLLRGVKDLYKKKLGITIEPGLWTETIGKWRNPQSLLTYALTLSKLPSPDRENLLALLGKFALSILQGTFKTVRDTLDSDHMQFLLAQDPHLLEAWKKGSVLASEEHLIVDTDHPCDLLLAGSEVGSCQSVDGDPAYSKCLVSYLLDPKIRMVAIKNKAGVIVARTMLRLLWEPVQKRIVLHQADNYNNGNTSFAQKLDAACLQRAQELGIPLYRSMPDSGDTVLLSFKSGIPYEYVDGARERVQKDGDYVIQKCACFYNP